MRSSLLIALNCLNLSILYGSRRNILVAVRGVVETCDTRVADLQGVYSNLAPISSSFS
jgi:undecaprenyl pyrophosphate synthase